MTSDQKNLQIIYEDNHLIAINKRAGDPVQGDESGDKPLLEVVRDYIKNNYHKPGNVFCGLIHRLDRPVSGVVLFARTSKALERMNEIFRSRRVEKIYWAIVKNKPQPEQATLINYLKKNQKLNKSQVVAEHAKDASLCELSYRVLAQANNYTLLEVKPKTGRHHQIRVQLSNIGCPIKGDLKYGFDRSNDDGSISLHARQLIFEHPVSKTQLNLIAKPPVDNLWTFFENNID